eukprot:10013-Heterococcus_DN1.PRE.6
MKFSTNGIITCDVACDQNVLWRSVAMKTRYSSTTSSGTLIDGGCTVNDGCRTVAAVAVAVYQ